MLRIGAVFIILTMLSGCFCLTEPEDKSDVPEYFSGCWKKVEDGQKW